MTLLWPALNGPIVDYISSPPSLEFCEKSRRKLVILGSTGSIGGSTLSVLERRPENFEVLGLAGGRNVELLARQALLYRPPFLAVLDEIHAARLRELLPESYKVEILSGVGGYAALAALPEADLVVSAQVGAAGLPATLAAALAGKVIALANKEALALAGKLLRGVCRRSGAAILPLDSEHFAIFQCLSGRGQNLSKLVLTASGGPFRKLSFGEMRKVLANDALKHPNWSMGRKISIDSATMMNKGLEIIEAHQLFGVSEERIEVLVHPQSIVHSMITLDDNSMLAQLAVPDMRGPIAACLFWPQSPGPILPAPNLAKIACLTFEEADSERFPALNLARQAMKNEMEEQVNSACVVMNAANEMAVEMFLMGKCAFTDIADLVKAAMQDLTEVSELSLPDLQNPKNNIPSLAAAIWDSIRSLDARSRDFVRTCLLDRKA